MDKSFEKYIHWVQLKVGQKAGVLGIYRVTLEDTKTKEKAVEFKHNVITIVGRGMIINNLTDATPTNDMLISHAALGDDDTAVDEADTVLGNETYRNAIASLNGVDNVGYATAFYTQTEVTGTFKEAGIFSDGTGSVDTGILLSHVNIDVTKTNTQKLTVDWTITIINVAP